MDIGLQSIIFLGVLILFSAIILWMNKGRNAWDILFFNSILGILGLFMVGILAHDSDVWKTVATGLVVVATGGSVVGYFSKSS